MFAAALRDPAEDVLRFARSLDPNAGFYMYLDDCYFLAAPQHLHTIMEYAVAAFGAIGLEVKLSKTQVWCAQRESLHAHMQQ